MQKAKSPWKVCPKMLSLPSVYIYLFNKDCAEINTEKIYTYQV